MINVNNIAILNINGIDYCCIISIITKSEAINLFRCTEFGEKSGSLQNVEKI